MKSKEVEKESEYQKEAKKRGVINCLYEYFKNTPKKLKVVCDWDEVIQPHEPYALWLTLLSEKQKKDNYVDEKIDFSEYFEDFWSKKEEPWINYSPYGSRLTMIENTEKLSQQQEIKNSPNFYQQAPFLTLAKELLKLVKENKVEVIFLSAYDKRIFPDGDPRKKKIFRETFGKFPNCSLNLVGFESEGQGQSKSEWVKKNVPNCEVIIDDNPNILNNIIKDNDKIIAIAPFYPTIKHHKKVILIKNSISKLKKEDF